MLTVSKFGNLQLWKPADIDQLSYNSFICQLSTEKTLAHCGF